MSEVDRDDLLLGVGGCGLCYVRKMIIKQNIGNTGHTLRWMAFAFLAKMSY